MEYNIYDILKTKTLIHAISLSREIIEPLSESQYYHVRNVIGPRDFFSTQTLHFMKMLKLSEGQLINVSKKRFS